MSETTIMTVLRGRSRNLMSGEGGGKGGYLRIGVAHAGSSYKEKIFFFRCEYDKIRTVIICI